MAMNNATNRWIPLVLAAAGILSLASSSRPKKLERPEAARAHCHLPPGQHPATYNGRWVVMLSDEAAVLKATAVVSLFDHGGKASLKGNYRWKASKGKFPQSKWRGNGQVAGGQLTLSTRVNKTGETGLLKLQLDSNGARLTGTMVQSGATYLVVACRIL